jgi:hypothetical protein
LLRIATTFLTASPYLVSSLAFASPSSFGRQITRPSSLVFISALFAQNNYRRSSSCKSTILAAAAEDNDIADGECNATNTDEPVTPPLSEMYDSKYPGTAVQRLRSIHERVAIIATDGTLDGPWEEVRRRILWAGGLKDLSDSVPGQGYTGHSFNDFNHVDLTAMNDDTSDNLNDGSVKGIMVGNRLGPGIRIASIAELGPGGSWSTCAMGCNSDPPNDVAHVQFRSKVAFKLVWVPNAEYDTFVLVDDDGKLLARGKPSDGPGALPRMRERQMNYQIMKGSKYATVAESLALNSTQS